MSVITASRYGDTLIGSPDSDTITGSSGPDSIAGGRGNDSIVSGSGFGDDATPDTLRGGAGNDVISQVGGYGGLLFGDDGDDTLSHDAPGPLNLGYYVFEGGPGSDVIEGNVTDRTTAWAGYLTATGGVQVDLSITGSQAVGGGAGIDILHDLSGVLGSVFNDTLGGGTNNHEELFGGPGDDVLRAGVAGGELHGDVGDDTLIGGPGADWADYGASVPKLNLTFLPDYAATSGVNVSLAISGPQAVGGGLGVDTLVNIDNLRGSRFGDTLVGSQGTNTLSGEAGDDSLSGGGGDDSLQGADGNNTVLGGAGNDTIFANQGANRLLGGDGDDVVTGQGRTDIEGNAGADTLSGGFGPDIIRGGRDDDSLSGGDGSDFLAGDRGSDTLSGGLGADIFHAWNGAGLDRVTDFSVAEGDRVMLLPGETPTISQVGADTVIDFGGGSQMVLVGVSMSTLPSGWIFGA
jgi:serralysin